MKKGLNVNWQGPLEQVLLPIDFRCYNASEYRLSLARAPTMKKLCQAIREGIDEMFDILCRHYVFYCPSAGG